MHLPVGTNGYGACAKSPGSNARPVHAKLIVSRDKDLLSLRDAGAAEGRDFMSRYFDYPTGSNAAPTPVASSLVQNLKMAPFEDRAVNTGIIHRM